MGTRYGSYDLDDRAGLFIYGTAMFATITGYLPYDPVSGVFGKDIQVIVQGQTVRTDGLTPITAEEYQRFVG